MSPEEMRLECLKLACDRGLPPSEVVAYAEQLARFISQGAFHERPPLTASRHSA